MSRTAAYLQHVILNMSVEEKIQLLEKVTGREATEEEKERLRVGHIEGRARLRASLLAAADRYK